MAILEVSNLKKIYTTRFGGNQVQALKNINFSVEEGEYVAIMGESGSGKTTLLNILAALDKPTAGEVLLNGKNLVSLKEKEISAFRREHLGFVFQADLSQTWEIRLTHQKMIWHISCAVSFVKGCQRLVLHLNSPLRCMKIILKF